jgi:hypothetical protein
MKSRRRGTSSILLFLVTMLGVNGCGFFGEPETVTEAWSGPGKMDEQIVPTRPEDDGAHSMDDENTSSTGISTPASTTDTWSSGSCGRRR